MTTEQKAKRYDEAFKEASVAYKDEDKHLKATLERIFPELAESEDERIRKGLINYFNDFTLLTFGGLEPKKVLAWLEKQGEQKPAEWDYNAIAKLADEYEETLRKESNMSENMAHHCRLAFFHGADAMLKKIQCEQKSADKVESKFKVGDVMRTLQEAADNITSGLPVVVSIDEEYYHCTNELIAIKDQDDYEFPSMNRKQKPVEKVESKFKVGDWIIYDRHISKVKDMDSEGYLVEDTYGDEGVPPKEFTEKHYRLWTIEDAKDGDVVVDKSDGAVGIFKSIGHHPDGGSYNDPSYCFLHCRYDDGYFYADFENGNTMDSDDVIPATKEQRDTLMKVMADAGYTFDFEKKELKEIKQKTVQETEPFEAEHGKYYYCIKDYFCGGKKQASKGDVVQALRGLPIMGLKDASEYFLPVNFIKCNSAWSEEDEDRLDIIFERIERGLIVDKDDIDRLKSLKNRVQPQKEWRQDNVEELTEFENAMMHIGGSFFGENAGLDPNDTNVIKEQANLLLGLVPSKEWGEEDGIRLQRIINFLWCNRKGDTDTIYQQEQDIEWLKSLRPQSHWKPSDEQMEALKEACDEHWEPDGLEPLYTLYQNLKKLKEE